MDWSPRYYIPSFVEIGPPVLEKKIFERLVMWPRSREQTYVPPIQGGSTQNLALIGQAVSEKKLFENVNGRRIMGIL